MTRFTALFLAVLVLPAVAEEGLADLPEKYKAVVDRFPFGQPPEGFDPLTGTSQPAEGADGAEALVPEIPLTQQQEALKHAVYASVLIINPVTRDPWLGFSDMTDPKSPRNYYLPVEGTQDDWTVKSVDIEKKSAVVAKGDVEIELVVGAQPEKGKGDPKAMAPGGRRHGASTAPGLHSPITGGATGVQPQPAQPAGAPSSLASLRRQRVERDAAQRQQLEEARRARFAAAEEARQKLEETERQRAQERAEREAQREAERQADRDEYNQRVKSLADEFERQRAAERQRKAEEGGGDE